MVREGKQSTHLIIMTKKLSLIAIFLVIYIYYSMSYADSICVPPPKSLESKKLLICPSSNHDPKNSRLLEGVIDFDSYYCDRIVKGMVIYSAEDMILAKEINTIDGMGPLCPSQSAYRVVHYTSPKNSEGQCQIVYDVYCEPGLVATKAPFETKICPARAHVTQVEAPVYKREEYNERPAQPCNQSLPCNNSPCGNNVLPCNSNPCGNSIGPCGQYQYLPYTGYYMMPCQGNDGNCERNKSIQPSLQ